MVSIAAYSCLWRFYFWGTPSTLFLNFPAFLSNCNRRALKIPIFPLRMSLSFPLGDSGLLTLFSLIHSWKEYCRFYCCRSLRHRCQTNWKCSFNIPDFLIFFMSSSLLIWSWHWACFMSFSFFCSEEIAKVCKTCWWPSCFSLWISYRICLFLLNFLIRALRFLCFWGSYRWLSMIMARILSIVLWYSWVLFVLKAQYTRWNAVSVHAKVFALALLFQLILATHTICDPNEDKVRHPFQYLPIAALHAPHPSSVHETSASPSQPPPYPSKNLHSPSPSPSSLPSSSSPQLQSSPP